MSLIKMFTIDLLDTVDILDVLFLTARDNKVRVKELDITRY